MTFRTGHFRLVSWQSGERWPQPRSAAGGNGHLRTTSLVAVLFVLILVGWGADATTAAALTIVDENRLPGNPASEWDISGAGDPSIQGFATQISVNAGQTVDFKIKTTSRNYRIDIYRLGYYGGKGARKVADSILVNKAQNQPNPRKDSATGLVDAGNWAASASWAVPANATSGVYIAKLVRQDGTLGSSHIPFIVRNDGGTSALVFQTSDTTWQAYNTWGGNSLYIGQPAGRAYKVSYNRPFTNRGDTTGSTGPRDFLFDSDYPMIRWLEANGYDVSYVAGVDVDRLDASGQGGQIRTHKIFLSVGHDEYWSGNQRANVEAARNAGVNLAFLSGNEVFWKTRWENSIDASTTPYRTLVCYKETHANAVIDPRDPPTWTGTWRDPRFSPPADGGRPENALTGTIFTVNVGSLYDMAVPASYGDLRFWRNTNIASGQSPTLSAHALTYEWDEDLDNGFRPAGLIRMSSTTDNQVAQRLLDYGSTYGPGTATHSLTLYRHPSRALVFSAGATRWAWGLDDVHDIDPGIPPPATQPPSADPRMQQAMVNLFADMGVQPATIQPGLVPATASTDATPPTSSITSPAAGAMLPVGSPVTISGTASDSGGGVIGGVEVSVDRGTTWHPGNGRAAWTYSWTPRTTGSVTIQSRAVDDSGNLQSSVTAVTVTVVGGNVVSIWGNPIPTVVAEQDPNAVELGVKFRSDVSGSITGIRFYKSASNTGTHVATLWSSSGQQLAQTTFAGETSSGWQQVTFATPYAIAANTVYVASYHTNVGYYSEDDRYFSAAGVDSPPLHALRDGESGGNGVYAYSGTPTFPSQTYLSANYWVDVLFAPR